MSWLPSRVTALGGRFRLLVSGVDVTSFRGVPTSIDSYSSGDPFGDSTAQFTFGAITPFDDFTEPDLFWLQDYANVDLYWLPAVPYAPQYAGYAKAIDTLSGQLDVVTPSWLLDSGGNKTAPNQVKIWEGFLISPEVTADESNAQLQVSCQGALFQLDHYLQKPFYPAQPWPLEKLIADVFDHARKPNLRTGPLTPAYIQFPAGWSDKVPAFTARTPYTPVAKPGSLWTGYTSRQTGAWDHALTGFVQDQLTVMITSAKQGVASGNQWTLQHLRAGQGSGAGRQPVLQVRDRFRPPDVQCWVGQPGVRLQLTRDGTQAENVIYGQGTSVDGVTWRNAVISNDGSRTDYLPLAADPAVYPAQNNPRFHPGRFVTESNTIFDAGFSQAQAADTAQQMLHRDADPGWTGTVTLSTDPRSPAGTVVSRWQLHAGITLLLQGFAGTGARGYPLHVSAVEADPNQGTVQLTVDSRYRDLLTLDQARERTRDPLTPTKMLQVNRASVLIQDVQAPWDYTAGSGFCPKGSTHFYDHMPTVTDFPYASWTRAHPPHTYPSAYVTVRADAPTSRARWSVPIPILTSEKDTIVRTQFAVYDINGNVLPCPFHLSIYYNNVTVDAMPFDGTDYSPWRDGAFESINPTTGQPWPTNTKNIPDNSFIVGWGNKANGVLNRAGFSPGSEAAGNQPTGLLEDDSTWSFDNTSSGNKYYNLNAAPGQRQMASAITLYAAFYAEWDTPVFLAGRLYRQNPGVS